MQIWEQTSSTLQMQDLEEIACIIRRIWFRRNNFVFEGKFDRPRTSQIGAKDKLQNYQHAIELLMLKGQQQAEASTNKELNERN